MQKTVKLFGLITLAALIVFTACDTNGPDGGGGGGITWTAVADGAVNTTTSSKITFTFSAAVSGLTESDITLTDGSGSATKGTLSGSGTNWQLGITVTTAGTVSVKITKAGISATARNVTVHKQGQETPGDITWTAEADGTSNATTSTKITFTFSEAVSGLTESDITLTDGTRPPT